MPKDANLLISSTCIPGKSVEKISRSFVPVLTVTALCSSEKSITRATTFHPWLNSAIETNPSNSGSEIAVTTVGASNESIAIPEREQLPNGH
jgi:hypothetical protein